MFAKINFLCRLIATGICFVVFGIGGFLLSFVGFRIVRGRYPQPEQHHPRIKYLISQAFALFMNFMTWAGVLRFEIVGREKVAEDSGCLVLANHPSLIDVIALISIYKKANCFVKEGLWENPFLRGIVSSAGYVKNDSSVDVLGLSRSALDCGDSMVIFPEGTRSVPGQELKLKRGAAHVALHMNVPIRLVHISMVPSTLTKAERWYNIPSTKAHFRLVVGEKIQPEDFPDVGIPQPLRARRLTQLIKEKLENAPSPS